MKGFRNEGGEHDAGIPSYDNVEDAQLQALRSSEGKKSFFRQSFMWEYKSTAGFSEFRPRTVRETTQNNPKTALHARPTRSVPPN